LQIQLQDLILFSFTPVLGDLLDLYDSQAVKGHKLVVNLPLWRFLQITSAALFGLEYISLTPPATLPNFVLTH